MSEWKRCAQANSVKLTSTDTVRSSPSRPNTLSGRTCTVTRSPDGAPHPASLTLAANPDPLAVLDSAESALMVRVRVVTPVPGIRRAGSR